MWKRRTNSEVELTGVSGRGQEGLQAVAYLPLISPPYLLP